MTFSCVIPIEVNGKLTTKILVCHFENSLARNEIKKVQWLKKSFCVLLNSLSIQLLNLLSCNLHASLDAVVS